MAANKALTVAQKAILGGLVADAAALPLHWFYDLDKLKEIVGNDRMKNPEFFTPMSTQFYTEKDFPGHYSLGQLSCYGEQTIMTMDYFKSTNGKFVGGESFAQFMFKWFTDYTGRLDHPTKEFLEKAEKLKEENKPLYPEAGANDKQTMHTFKIPVIALKLANSDEKSYFSAVEEATRAHQNTDMCSSFGKTFAIMLKSCYKGEKLPDVIDNLLNSSLVTDEVKKCITFAWERRSKADFDETGFDQSLRDFSVELSLWLFENYGGSEQFKTKVGLTCGFPGSFMASIKILGDTFESIGEADFKTEAFKFAVRRNILFGGDNCGRTMVVGCLAVANGAEIPDEFLDQLKDKDNYIKEICSL